MAVIWQIACPSAATTQMQTGCVVSDLFDVPGDERTGTWRVDRVVRSDGYRLDVVSCDVLRHAPTLHRCYAACLEAHGVS